MTQPPHRPHWRVHLYYPTPPDTTMTDLTDLQTLVVPRLTVASLHPDHGWGSGGDWLWFMAHRRRAVSALWAAAWAHRYVRRAWAAWAGVPAGAVPAPERLEVTNTSILEH